MRKAVVAALVVLAACTRVPGAFEHPSGSNLVVRVEQLGGLLPPWATYHSLPDFTLVGDGRAILPGAQIAIYPPPALPSLIVRDVSDAGLQTILGAAKAAGLMNGTRTVPPPNPVADAPETVFTVAANGRTSVTRVQALGVSDETGERKAMAGFRDHLLDLQRWLPAGTVSAERSFPIDALRVVVLPPGSSPEPTLQQTPKTWPLPTPLSQFGEPIGSIGARCGIVRDGDLDRLLPMVRESNQLTPWRSGGTQYLLAVRPLLPDETRC